MIRVMRCPDCNKFVSFDDPEVELEDVDIADDNVFGMVHITLNCGECGTALAETYIDFQASIPECTCRAGGTKDGQEFEDGLEPNYVVSNEGEPEGYDRYQTHKTNSEGKKVPIKQRYQKHFYGARGVIEIQCDRCDDIVEVEYDVEEQASCFDALV